ncbi:50S ribosomal protein L15 [Candidatus Saccharibacteria bacterium]|nr:50S ribosomal protein L15 [Candidatus Saccharibacteria bacterium]
MIELNNLSKISRNRKRKGRGISANQGKTAGRGTKGQKSRTGFSTKPGFEGGQTKLIMRLPKNRGFNKFDPNRVRAINIRDIERLGLTKVGPSEMVKAGVIRSEDQTIKVIGQLASSTKIDIVLDQVSKGAVKSIKEAGGSVKLRNENS